VNGKNKVIPDTNTILRYLLRDNEEQFIETERFFEKVREGTVQVFLLEGVVAECIYVLTKFYNVPKPEAVSSIKGILRYKGVISDDKDAMLAALSLFAENSLDLVDCIVIANGRQWQADVFTFDKKMRRLMAH
jgi:predicted nucleic-acid-binding protein